ncbi:MAG: lycopene cyclase family protein, partial [Promethearchaeota archaeon]
FLYYLFLLMDQNIEKFDLAIIGASIAGNYLAYLLSKSNLQIVVLEEHKDIGLPFQCTGIISQKLSQLIELPEEIVLNRVQTVKIFNPSGKFIKLSGNEHPYVVDRIALDRLFYTKNENTKNITYYLGERFRTFKHHVENGQKSVLIETSKRVIIAKMLIGCDGPLSSVGTQLKVKNKVLYAAQIRIKGNFPENEAVMYFHPLWKQLFGWIVPEGNNVYRIGIASSKNIKKCFNVYLKKLGIDINKKIDQQGGIIPYGIMNKSAFKNVLLLGDAAGQVKATTGGGIVMLLTAARHASNCVKLSFKENNFSKRFIKKHYEKPCLRTIGKELKLHYVIRLILERLTNKEFEIFFRIVKENKIGHIITLYGDMDFPRELIFKLLRNFSVISFLIKFVVKNPSILFKVLKILIY